MKRLFVYLLICCIVSAAPAQKLYDQLCAFNPNWQKYEARAPKEEAIKFTSDKEYIQTHLNYVLGILRSNSTKKFSKVQKCARTKMIALLSAYREAGNFPKNYYRKERLPVFIDEHGTHCAVAFLMANTGNEEMAQRIAAVDNYAWVKDIKDKDLVAWQQASGLTLEELKLIQGAYDSYLENAFALPNRFEIPQKPGVMLVYFNEKKSESTIWCKGEGNNGILNGKWVQNYAIGLPWIEGYYENGKRTGLWKEYYQGTNQLCRTENWRNDKLNGIRKRYDKSGKLIEEIMFKNGKAELKTNYEESTGLKWVRKPLDSNLVYTEVYTMEGLLLAAGKETIDNPGNLQWFQNIELTALNTFSVAADKIQPINYISASGSAQAAKPAQLYAMPPLVEYKKEGHWIYYHDYNYNYGNVTTKDAAGKLNGNFKTFGSQLYYSVGQFTKLELGDHILDSLVVEYTNNRVNDLYVYGENEFAHIKVFYPSSEQTTIESLRHVYWHKGRWYGGQWHFGLYPELVSAIVGQYNKNGERISEWRYYDDYGKCYKTEHYLFPWKEEESLVIKETPKSK